MIELKECVEILDSKRIPLSSSERKRLKKIYPYYGAQGIIDYVENYIFDGEYILIAEDGNNLKSLQQNIATWVEGKFWVNNHAHILGKKKGYNLRYIYYLLSILDLRGYITGSAQPKLNQENLASIQLQLPNINRQNKVAQILSCIDNKIEINNKINSELEAMEKVIYNYWFLQFEFPNEQGRPYKSSGGKMVWNEELKREIPVGWKVKKIGETFSSSRGISYNSKNLGEKGVPMINLASFKPGGGYKIEGIKKFTGDYDEDKCLKAYDLVICNTQQTAIDYSKDIIGNAFLIPDIFESDIVSSHHVTTIKVKNENIKYYLCSLFNTKHFHRYIAGFTNGTNILGLLFNGVENYKSEIPDEKTLERYSIFCRDIEKKKESNYKRKSRTYISSRFFTPTADERTS